MEWAHSNTMWKLYIQPKTIWQWLERSLRLVIFHYIPKQCGTILQWSDAYDEIWKQFPRCCFFPKSWKIVYRWSYYTWLTALFIIIRCFNSLFCGSKISKKKSIPHETSCNQLVLGHYCLALVIIRRFNYWFTWFIGRRVTSLTCLEWESLVSMELL